MLVADPKQPTQPRLVRPTTLESEFLAMADDFGPLFGGPPFVHTDPAWRRVLIYNYAVGGAEGIVLGGNAMQALIWNQGRELYDGAYEPYVKRSSAMKYGGLAAVIGGVVMLAIRGGVDGGMDSADASPIQLNISPGHASVSAVVPF